MKILTLFKVRRRMCSNPPPKHGGHHCSGHDFLIKNCTGGMCRKLGELTGYLSTFEINAKIFSNTKFMTKSVQLISFVVLFPNGSTFSRFHCSEAFIPNSISLYNITQSSNQLTMSLLSTVQQILVSKNQLRQSL